MKNCYIVLAIWLQLAINLHKHVKALSYVAYNGFVKSEQAIVESNKSKPVDEGGDTFIFNSPKPIDEIEAARQLKKTKRDLSEGF